MRGSTVPERGISRFFLRVKGGSCALFFGKFDQLILHNLLFIFKKEKPSSGNLTPLVVCSRVHKSMSHGKRWHLPTWDAIQPPIPILNIYKASNFSYQFYILICVWPGLVYVDHFHFLMYVFCIYSYIHDSNTPPTTRIFHVVWCSWLIWWTSSGNSNKF